MKKHFTKKEQQQLALICVLVVVGAVYGVWALVIVPMKKASRRRVVKLEELVKQNTRAQTAVNAIAADEAHLAAINEQLEKVADTYAVRPILGSSYQLGLRARLDPLAQATGFSLLAMVVQEPLPMPRKRPGAPFSLCTADIRGLGSYEQVRDFIAAVEADNPYVHISGLTITAHATNPKRHRVTLRIECLSAPLEPKRQ